ncbi:hypothetical protein GGR54DRAFT_599453 [Hypoxylon sp. NC1633]|nr:hypothetical protein GGR54DRAFT_599453 [Hypoxylon sp. NC1633]
MGGGRHLPVNPMSTPPTSSAWAAALLYARRVPIFPIPAISLLASASRPKVHRLISRSRGSQHGSRSSDLFFYVGSAKSLVAARNDGIETVERASKVWPPSRITERGDGRKRRV